MSQESIEVLDSVRCPIVQQFLIVQLKSVSLSSGKHSIHKDLLECCHRTRSQVLCWYRQKTCSIWASPLSIRQGWHRQGQTNFTYTKHRAQQNSCQSWEIHKPRRQSCVLYAGECCSERLAASLSNRSKCLPLCFNKPGSWKKWHVAVWVDFRKQGEDVCSVLYSSWVSHCD